MRTIERTTAFKRDYKREIKGPHRDTLEDDLADLVQLLATDTALPVNKRDHSLTGNWSGYRECHLKPDLLVIYRKENTVLQLIRLGSHKRAVRLKPSNKKSTPYPDSPQKLETVL